MKQLAVAFLILAGSLSCFAGGPRFVTGTGFSGASSGQRIAWYTPQLTYYTDPGDLSVNATHAQADAMVAAAAATWNVPYASLTLAQGGVLAEHVSDQNAYFNGTSLVWPADVMSTNYTSRPIAVIYDTDGSITDMLLGEGASDPAACHHNAVTESVDSFGQTGTIQHALLVLNGRCVGSAPQQMLQMQYQVERAFGRILGLAWSQCNDNVFTAATAVTADEQANWPIMHPIDVICGTYTYQCLRNPFQLRVDDISSLALLYPVTSANLAPGKSLTVDANSMSIDTALYFNDQLEMENANIVVLWNIQGVSVPTYQSVSAVSGATFERMAYTPITGNVPASDDVGSQWGGLEGYTSIARLPLNFANGRANDVDVIAETINPLYTGEYAVGTYKGAPLSFYGTSSGNAGFLFSGNLDFTPLLWANNEPDTCNTGNDGTATAPVAVDPSGWWTGLICSLGHVSYLSQTIRAGRTFTLEVTSLDETGAPTTTKLRPVVGVWKSTDSIYAMPTVASVITPMNSLALGVTQLAVASSAQDQSLRIAIADAYGAGRPDLAYKARLLYADSISPSTIGAGGGIITITGMGFRAGNRVTINGAVATVTSWGATQIMATVPAAKITQAAIGTPVDVTVTDTATEGTTTMTSALVYTSSSDAITLVSAPATLETGVVSSTSFAVRVVGSDGKTPVSGASVLLSIIGNAMLAVCGTAQPCVVTTDNAGMVTTTVTGTAAGVVTLTATEMSGGTSVSARMNDVDPVRTLTSSATTKYLAEGASASFSLSVQAVQDGVAAPGVAVVWSASGATISAAQSVTDSNGTASATMQIASAQANSTASATVCAWGSICATMQVVGVAQPQWSIAVSSGAGQVVKTGTPLAPVMMQVTDQAGHPLQGATVQLYQTDDAWQPACPARGACPIAPVLAKSSATVASDANGVIAVTPLVTAGVPQVVNIVASTGTQGFITITLDVTP